MNTLPMLNDGYALARTAGEYRRLSEQADIWERATNTAFDRVALPAGARVLDVGCGPGDVMRLIGGRVGPRGAVIGVDSDAQAGQLALTLLRSANPDLFSFVAGDVNELDSVPGGPFDVVFARLLIFHMAQPLTVLKKLWRWTRPGGTLLIMDYDVTGARSAPQHQTLEHVLRLVRDAFRRAGRDIEVGSRLPELFVKAEIGAPDGCEINSVIMPAEFGGSMLRAILPSLRSVIARYRLADAHELDRVDHELAALCAPGVFMRLPDMVTAWKTKRSDA